MPVASGRVPNENTDFSLACKWVVTENLQVIFNLNPLLTLWGSRRRLSVPLTAIARENMPEPSHEQVMSCGKSV